MILSHSEIATYQVCHRKHANRYTHKRVNVVPSEALVRGKVHHAWLAEWWSETAMSAVTSPADVAMQRGYNAIYQSPEACGFTDATVNVPFRIRIARDVELVGEVDVTAVDADGQLTVIEHKTTSRDITPGSTYLQEMALVAAQPSIYSLAFPGCKVLFDFLRKPILRQLKATPPELRKHTKAGALYAGQRESDETDEEYTQRILHDMSERPEFYFARVAVVRHPHESAETIRDILETARALQIGYSDRSPSRCFDYGQRCEYFAACWEGADLQGPLYMDRPAHDSVAMAEARGS